MPFISRAGRPGLLGIAARTAVAAGTATAVSGAVARRQHQRAVAESAPMEAAMPAAPALAPTRAPAPDAGGADLVAQLQQLAALQQQGFLTAEEFDRAKRQLLGG